MLTGVAVEVQAPKGVGRCRMLPLADASAASLHPFVTDHVAPRATVITDGWAGYSGLEKIGYVHDRRSQRAARACGEDPGALLPAVHRVVSPGQTLAAGHPPGLGGAGAPGQLPAGAPAAAVWSSTACSNSP